MKKVILFLSAMLLTACNHSPETKSYFIKTHGWKIGAKIHFAEDSAADYLGIKEINKITRDTLKSVLGVHKDSGADNAKILLKKDNAKIQITHYEEKSSPCVGEEMHATLLYTSSRGFNDSETLHQVCRTLFKECKNPPSIESVAKEYDTVIEANTELKISSITLTKGNRGTSFIMAKLLLNERENIYKGDTPISAGLHMTLVICTDNSILSDPKIGSQLIEKLNKKLKEKMIRIATKNGVADLEFGLSGQSWRIRAGERFRD